MRETFPLGFIPDIQFAPEEVALQPLDRLLLFSDGLYEAPSMNGELWGRTRLEERFITHRRHSLADCINQTIRAARDWQGLDRFPDDVALLGLEIGGLALCSEGDTHAS
jgi:sigma-B regulation protein RsbU (phosphoserine phosphatase)